MSRLNALITCLEEALECYWDDIANIGIPTDSESVYIIAQEIEELGVGAVLIPTMQGRLAWFDLANMEF